MMQVSLQTLQLLQVFMEDPSQPRYGLELAKRTGLKSGTVYPALGRLERDGYVRSKWESHAVAQREKRPPRRYYEITAAGSRALATSVEHYRTLGERLGLVTRKPSAG